MTFYSRLADISMEEFSHNNMIPFFGGGITQNLNENMNQTLLEKYTGVDDPTRIEKNEVNNFTDIRRNIYNDQKNAYLTQYDRMDKPVKHNNVLPVDSIKVGPGTKNTDPVLSTGGYQQDDFRDFQYYKDIDELRVKTNPKETYEGRIIDGNKELKRGKIGELHKNRVDTFYEKSQEDLFKTTGSYLKEKNRPCVDVKNTNRKDSYEYQGIPHKNIGNKHEGAVKEPFKRKLNSFGSRNNTSTTYGKGYEYDYGKQNILVYNNERDVTSMKTYEGNITSYIKSMIVPFTDVFKRSNKEYFVQNARDFGNMQTTYPKKQTIYNPNNVAKTTIKETLVEDTRTGNLKGFEQITTYDPNDVARTTIKETLIHDTKLGNLNTTSKSIVYNPNDIAKTTQRETLEDIDDTMNLKGHNMQKVYNPNNKARTTIKETTIDNDILGIVSGNEKGEGYLTNKFDAKHTNKQFTSDNEYVGNVEKTNSDGYKNLSIEVKNTNKQITSDNEHFGAVSGDNTAMMSYEDIYNAVINETKETTLNKPKPTQNNVKLSAGSQFIHLTNEKVPLNTENVENISKIYQEPPSTNLINVTQTKNNLNAQEHHIDSTLLNAFRENPYTHPLNSVA